MNVPQNSSRSSGARRAWAQPRFLFGAAAFTLAGATLASYAVPLSAKDPVAMPHIAASQGKSKPLTLNDLPKMVEQYGQANLVKSLGASATTGGRTTSAIGTGQTGFNLVETDLTPNSPSDERQPAVSPTGDFIAFMSNGADTNNDGVIDSLNADGKYHIWIMNRNGSGQRQLTGVSAILNGTTGDINRNQRHPSWSSDGNRLVYEDEDAATPATTSQLWTIEPLVDTDGNAGNGTQIAPPTQQTYFPGKKESPAWSPTGLSIAYVTNYDAINNVGLPTRDIYSIDSQGNTGTLTRITGGSNDPVGNSTDDDHPSWAAVNRNLLFFSSNRDVDGVLTGAAASGRRIWRIFPDGSGANPVTDPTQRSNGRVDDQDDFPAASTPGGFGGSAGVDVQVQEQIAFQTNTYLDDTDQADGARGRDLNVWSIPLDTSAFTAPGTQAEPRVYVAAFDATASKVVVFNTNTLLTSDTFAQLPVGGTIGQPESVQVFPGTNSSNNATNFVYVTSRTGNRIARFDESNGAPAGGNVLNTTDANYEATAPAYALTPAKVPGATGLAVDNQYVYAASSNSSTALYRFVRATGTPAGASNTDPAWSSGETSAGAVGNCEGISIDPSGRWIAVSVYGGDKVNLYDKATGTFIIDYVPTGQNQLSGPTGIDWGKDINGDGYPDLYVCSTKNDRILAFAGPNPNIPNASITRGTFINTVVSDNAEGNQIGLNSPEGLTVEDLDGDGNDELYVSNFRPVGNTQTDFSGDGTIVSRYEMNGTSGVPWPRTAAQPDPTSTSAIYLVFPSDANDNPTATGPAGIAFNPAALVQDTGPGTTITPDETSGAARVLTNILSSPKNFTDSRLTAPQTIDRAADREPSYARARQSGTDPTGTAPQLASLVYASGRRFAPNTGTNGSTTPSNPYGGDQFGTDGGESGVTHDIWSTSTQDTTPPALIPQGVGNLLTPVVAPQPSAPFLAPRTVEAGLKENMPAGTDPAQGGLRFAVVLRDLESGLFERAAARTDLTVNSTTSVYVSFYNADSRYFAGYDSQNPGVKERRQNDDNVFVDRTYEERPSPVSIGGRTQFALNVYDDGPVSANGHEQQASAVAGDGVYYCEGYLPTPAAGDYYIDVTARDRALRPNRRPGESPYNTLLYDRVWGFSTRRFTPVNADLFVSDYAGGQDFANLIASGGDDRRFSNQPPVESYYLTNPGGQAWDSLAATATFLGASTPTSFSGVDVWRTLCRGIINQDVLNGYRPTTTVQIDPASTDKTQLSRKVAVSRSCVIWAAPYAGTAYVGPGTIVDPTTQERLRNFVGDGGRLFISGRDIAWALTSNGANTNTFLSDVLGANFTGEPLPQRVDAGLNRLTADTGEFLNGGLVQGNLKEPTFDGSADFGGDYPNLRFPFQLPFPSSDGDWGDGAVTQDQERHNAFPFDYFAPTASSGATLTTSYTHDERVVGQRIEKLQPNGLQSRVVFFSFGFEAINRRYRRPTPADGRAAIDSRYRIANYIRSYFKTGSASGRVINNDTNKPIANFLLQITGRGQTYLARTDVNGDWSLTGLPFGGYTVQPFLTNGRTDPPGFFGGTTTGFFINLTGPPGPNATLVNLRPVPTRPGAIIGRAVASNGTPTNLADDYPLANLNVLVRSIDKLVTTDPPGYFARLTTTDSNGNFQVGQVPSGVPIQVIFNPANSNPANGDNQDIPASTNITFTGNNPNVGRRVIPDSKRPADIIVPPNDTYYVNDIANDTAANQTTPILVPIGPAVSGTVSLNGTPLTGATVSLLKSDKTPATYPNNVAIPVQTTPATGAYNFTDVPPGSYFVRASIVRGTITFVRDTQITVVQGVDQTRDVDIVIATLSGKVLQSNGQPAANITVTLQFPNGIAFSPARTATTNAQGNYTIANVPVGGYSYDSTTRVASFVAANGSVTYNVIAAQGALTGTSGNFSVNATASAVTVPTITLSNQQLTGKVLVQYYTVGGTYIVPFAGATVELLDTNQAPLSPRRTTTSANDGSYAFAGVTAGRYYIKATGGGDESISAPFNATAGAFSAPDVTLVLQRLAGDVIDISGARVPGATVTLTQNGTTIATMVTDSMGAFSFVVAEGDGYALTAVKGTSSGSANVGLVKRRVVPKRALITIKFTPTVTPNPTTFSKGRTYAISFPYQTSANAASRNLYDRTRGDATVALVDVFNYDPVGTKAGKTVRFYSVSRFNPNTLAYEAIADTGVLVRGEGYLLQVIDTPTSGEVLRFSTPAENSALQALTLGTGENTRRFTISLGYSNSLVGNALNGRTFIGFPFNPALYSSVAWDTTSTGTDGANGTSAQIQYGGVSYTVKDAAAAGLINSTLIDATTGRSVTSLGAYGGYFVTARREGVKLRLQFPTPNN